MRARRVMVSRSPETGRIIALGSAVVLATLVLTVLLFGARSACAHPLAPSTLVLSETNDGSVEQRFRTPSLRPVNTDVAPRIPKGCILLGQPVTHATDIAVEEVTRFRCEGGLGGKTISLAGLDQSPTNVLWRIALADGTTAQGLLDETHTSFTVPRKPRGMGAFAEYVRLGVHHLLTGLDHVLFVLSLLFVLEGSRRLVLAVTAFTLGHSASLALASLGVVHVPAPPVEIAIAVTLLFSAFAMLERHRTGHSAFFERHPALLSALFGLVHGLGFAAVLLDAGLPHQAVPPALLGFNVGIELGQLGVLATALTLRTLAAKVPTAQRVPLRLVSAYAVGSIAAMWILERTLKFVI